MVFYIWTEQSGYMSIGYGSGILQTDYILGAGERLLYKLEGMPFLSEISRSILISIQFDTQKNILYAN